MAGRNDTASLWALVEAQHGVIARRQLLAFGYGRHAIEHRIARGRLHPKARGVYAVGRPDITRPGELIVAALACGPGALLSDESAGEGLGILDPVSGPITVTCPRNRQCPGVSVHRRLIASEDRGTIHGLPVTSPARTLVDLAGSLARERLERAVNVADSLDLVDPGELRGACRRLSGARGAPALRRLLDRHTFRLTDSVLEQRFLALVRVAGLPTPETQRRADGFRVDFVWPELGLVVQTDSLRYHRTPAQQARDRLRDRAHRAAGRTCLRFTHAEVTHERDAAARDLAATARRLEPGP